MGFSYATLLAVSTHAATKFLHQLQQKSHPTSLIIIGTNLASIPAVSILAYSASKAAFNTFVYCLRAQNMAKSTKIIEIWPPVVQSMSCPIRDWP